MKRGEKRMTVASKKKIEPEVRSVEGCYRWGMYSLRCPFCGVMRHLSPFEMGEKTKCHNCKNHFFPYKPLDPFKDYPY